MLAAKVAEPEIHNISVSVCVFALIFLGWGLPERSESMKGGGPGSRDRWIHEPHLKVV